jgi:small neutral amino acid transporter SnatA (MarC family)
MLKQKTQNQIMKNKLIAGGTILMLAATAVLGQDNATNNQSSHFDQSNLYRANELSLGVLPSGNTPLIIFPVIESGTIPGWAPERGLITSSPGTSALAPRLILKTPPEHL